MTPKVTNLLSLVQRIPGDCDLYTCVLCEYLWKRLVVRCFCFNPLFTEPECSITMQLFTLNSTTASMYMYEVLKEFLMRTKKYWIIYKQLGILIKHLRMGIFVIQPGKSRQASVVQGT